MVRHLLFRGREREEEGRTRAHPGCGGNNVHARRKEVVMQGFKVTDHGKKVKGRVTDKGRKPT